MALSGFPPDVRPRAKARRITAYLAAGYFVVTIVIWLAMWVSADELPLPTLIIFGPRWIVVLPFLVLVPLAIYARSRWSAAFILLAGLVVIGPILGGRVNVGEFIESDRPSQGRLRVVTWNMAGLRPGPAVHQFLEETEPAILVSQESGLSADLLPEGWTMSGVSSNRIASRLPIRFISNINFSPLGVGGGVGRFVLDTPNGQITLVDVHLPTVRSGIEVALGTKFRDLSELRKNIQMRAQASRTARAWVGDASQKILIMGDFNMPVESRIYRGDWSDFRNAFSEVGNGWGTTKQTSWFGARIDHILYPPSWECRNVWVGPAMYSDHCPMIADLYPETD